MPPGEPASLGEPAIGAGLGNPLDRVDVLDRQLDAVMLFSPRSAQLLWAQMVQHGLQDLCRSIAALCISDAVANVLPPLAFAEVQVAKQPKAQSMIALLPRS